LICLLGLLRVFIEKKKWSRGSIRSAKATHDNSFYTLHSQSDFKLEALPPSIASVSAIAWAMRAVLVVPKLLLDQTESADI
jgi:hypothetical protein